MSDRSTERQPLLNGRTPALPGAEERHDGNQASLEEIKGVQLYLALLFPMIGLLLTALDTTMVATISATIAADFSSLAAISWLGSAYLVGYAAIQPISGKLTDLTGRRTGFFYALFAFGVGNLMCALATNEATLIGGRVVAGVGGGAISSIGVFIISDLLPLRQRPVWQSLTSVFYAIGMGIGAVIGGVINDAIGWRWNFIILMPCTVLLAVASYFTMIRGLPRPNSDTGKVKSAKDFDMAGSALLIGALVCVVLSLNLQEEDKNQIASMVLLIVGAIIFVGFLMVEIWIVSDPVVPLHLLLDRSVMGACVAGFLISVTLHSLVFYVPILIQARGFNSSSTGLQLLGNPAGAVIGPMSAGVAMRVMGGYGIVKPIVYASFLAGTIGFYFSTLETPVWATVTFYALLGGGFGSILTLNITGMLANIDDRLQASSTSMLYAFRQVGASVGLAISGIIFRKRIEFEHSQIASPIINLVVQLAAPGAISQQCNRNNYEGDDPPSECHIYFKALHDVFLFTLIVTGLGCIFGMLIRNKPLDREKSKKLDDSTD